jgi:hypothetical protein
MAIFYRFFKALHHRTTCVSYLCMVEVEKQKLMPPIDAILYTFFHVFDEFTHAINPILLASATNSKLLMKEIL